MALGVRLVELEEDQKTQLRALSPLYAEIVMRHSSYKQQHRDRLFFEHMYEVLIAVLDQVFASLKKRNEIENECGHLFRSKYFNLYKRRNAPPRSVDTLTVREVYALKHETEDRSLNAKLISSLYDKPSSLAVQAASVTTSPLVSSFIVSPIVARCITKDP